LSEEEQGTWESMGKAEKTFTVLANISNSKCPLGRQKEGEGISQFDNFFSKNLCLGKKC
jgi:hypothetical protein